jgi:hypothetical protein
MIGLLFAAQDALHWQNNDLWFAIWLTVAFSLVYAATRSERMVPILVHAARVAVSISAVMIGAFIILACISWYVSLS